jgi:hypothetical protein
MCDLLTRPHGLAFGVTDGARTRDLRSHKWVVGTQGAVEGGLLRVEGFPDEGGSQYGCSMARVWLRAGLLAPPATR